MHITAREEYGLRCALQLARAYGGGSVSASQIAQLEGISVEYVSKFMHLYKKNGLVEASRGVRGGFSLIKAPQDVSLNEVFKALVSSVSGEAKALAKRGATQAASSFCDQYAGSQDACVHIEQCSIRSVWQLLEHYFTQMTRQLSLGDLLQQESVIRQHVEGLVTEKVRLVKQNFANRALLPSGSPPQV